MKTLDLALDGRSLEAVWIGPPPEEAPTLVMLHEGLGSVGQWKDVPARLAAETGCGVLVYSRFGYGASAPVALPRPLTYMHDEALQVLPRLLDRLAIRRCVLAGHSDGASIATIYAGGAQDFRIRGLALIAPHFIVEDVSIASIAKAKDAYAHGDLRERLKKYHGENVDIAFKGWNDAWLDPQFRAWRIDDSIAYIRVPILIVQGEDDQYGTVRQVEVPREECYCPVEVALLPATGHAPHKQAPDVTLHTVADFVNRLLVEHREAAMS